MAEKDAVQKTLESYNDVFADIVNVLLFNGKRIIKENALTDAQESSYYKMTRLSSLKKRGNRGTL